VVLVLLIRAELGRVRKTNRNVGSSRFIMCFFYFFSKGKGMNSGMEVLFLLGFGRPWGWGVPSSKVLPRLAGSRFEVG
jgi:hypothetical protein